MSLIRQKEIAESIGNGKQPVIDYGSQAGQALSILNRQINPALRIAEARPAKPLPKKPGQIVIQF